MIAGVLVFADHMSPRPARFNSRFNLLDQSSFLSWPIWSVHAIPESLFWCSGSQNFSQYLMPLHFVFVRIGKRPNGIPERGLGSLCSLGTWWKRREKKHKTNKQTNKQTNKKTQKKYNKKQQQTNKKTKQKQKQKINKNTNKNTNKKQKKQKQKTNKKIKIKIKIKRLKKNKQTKNKTKKIWWLVVVVPRGPGN